MAAADAATVEALPQNVVFVDLETTGAHAASDRITEIGIVRWQDGELAEEWSTLVNPGCAIPAFIEAFTGISNSMVADAPSFAQIAAQVREKLGSALFVAHNARFDYSFLRSEFQRLSMSFNPEVLCTVKLSRRIFPQFARHNLDAVMERNGLSCSARHRALGDAQVLHAFWRKLKDDLGEQALAAAANSVISTHKLPAHLPPGLANELPESAGVYRFFGENDQLLYVGRGSSLRARICGHFAANKSGARDRALASEVRRIDWRETGGELGAVLCEWQWLKAQKPLYGRHPKLSQRFYTLRLVVGEAGLFEAVPVDQVQPLEMGVCFGAFNSAKEARKALAAIARAHNLCLKVLGLEAADASCLAYQSGRCKGACIGKEPPLLHNVRAQLALSSLKLKSWPFAGRIALREPVPQGGFLSGASRLHVFDHWTYLGAATDDAELGELKTAGCNTGFDTGMYRFLVRHFANNPRLELLDLQPAPGNAAG